MTEFLARGEVEVKFVLSFIYLFFRWGYPGDTEWLIENSRHCNIMSLLLQIKRLYICQFISVLCSVLLDYLSILEPISHHFSSCNFIITLDILKSKPFGLILFLHDCLVFLGRLCFHIYIFFRFVVSVSTKVTYLILIGIMSNLWPDLWDN